MERKATLQNEINEIEARIAESRVPPAVQVVFPPRPADENDEDQEIENEAPATGPGVGDVSETSLSQIDGASVVGVRQGFKALPATGRMMHKVRSVIFLDAKAQETKKTPFLNCVVQVPTGLRQPEMLPIHLDLFPNLSF